MPAASITDVVKLTLVELLMKKRCVTIGEVVEQALAKLQQLGVSASRAAVKAVAKTVVSKSGRSLGACWAPGEPGKVCRC